ncbi:MAG: exodeoxyribonuclease VII small subunit [Firmicutes bacterium]|nr:exodeoxyribonuclease VII small subunit [Bacillota bacterium]
MKFEKAMDELEQVVRRLESGEPDLEEALKLFERGVKLARVCNEHLEKAESQVKVLLEGDVDAAQS